jgi:outer membrane lipoprotein SlyB
VELPPSPSYRVSARTSFGRISSAVPITAQSSSDESLIGTIGGGACKLDLVNSNGSITINQ